MSNFRAYVPCTDPRGRLTWVDMILNTLTTNSLSVWGFVIVRCSYIDEAKWQDLLANLEERTRARPDPGFAASPASIARLNESLRWTTIEDRVALDGACIEAASRKFKEWVETVGRDEIAQNDETFSTQDNFPRYTVFLYVNANTLEKQNGGYQPTLVRYDLNLNPPELESWETELEEPDESFYKLHANDNLMGCFGGLLELDDWYIGFRDRVLSIQE